MARQYFKEDSSVLIFNSVTGMLDDIGSGNINISVAKADNSALMDDWTDANPTKATATLTAELAADSTGPNWFLQKGQAGTLTYTDSNCTVTGTFICLKAEKVLGDALRWNVDLESKGTVTVS